MSKRPFFLGALCAAFFSLSAPAAVSAETTRWFRSDGAGIAYEEIVKAIAMRAEWALEITTSDPAEKGSGELLKGDRTEKKVLYEHGRERRTVVSYLDGSGFAHFTETVSDDLARAVSRYDSQRRVIDETTKESDGSGTVVKYKWFGSRLASASAYDLGTPEGGAPLWTDTYRYDRSGALLSVSREPDSIVFSHDSRRGVPRLLEFRSSDGSVFRTTFDASGREEETASYDPEGKKLNSERIVYTKAESSKKGDGEEIRYDDKSREILLIRFDKDGKALEEVKTEWTGDRVSALTRTRGDQVRRTEYAYDSRGNRLLERNYLNGRLERSVRKEGPTETEELYKNGVLLLRAEYENGVLLREKRERRPPAGEER